MAKSGWFGVIATLLYLLFLAFFLREKLGKLGSLELNNFGDFLAGAFGPLAIFWLVLGFFQQGSELRNSIKSLNLQTRELKESVAQQRELARISKDQFQLQEKEFHTAIQRLGESIQPKFIVSYLGHRDIGAPWENPSDTQLHHQLAFANVGGTACEVEMRLSYGCLEPESGPIVVWPQFEIHNRRVPLYASDTHGDGINLVVEYKDALGHEYTEEFLFVRISRGDFPKFEIQIPSH
jgi:hypothetical protein